MRYRTIRPSLKAAPLAILASLAGLLIHIPGAPAKVPAAETSPAPAALEASSAVEASLTHDAHALRMTAEGHLALGEGRYEAAGRLLTGALQLERSHRTLAGLAAYHQSTGNVLRAAELLDEALKSSPASAKAQLHRSRARLELERGRLRRARNHYDRAVSSDPSSWQAQLELAQLMDRLGQGAQAIARCEKIAATEDAPEVQDGLAQLLQNSAPERAAKLRGEARAKHLARLAKGPATADVIRHFLETEDQPQRALDLARSHAKRLPGGAARTLLAQAYFKAGNTAAAAREIRQVLSSPWRSAETFATASIIWEREGATAAARAHADQAMALAADAMQQVAWLRDAGG